MKRGALRPYIQYNEIIQYYYAIKQSGSPFSTPEVNLFVLIDQECPIDKSLAHWSLCTGANLQMIQQPFDDCHLHRLVRP
jgi:hypothetical protein